MIGGSDPSQAVASGAVPWAAVRADRFELVQGNAEGRTRADQITVFKNSSGAHLNLLAASALSGSG
jgi:ornithine cyclodeaminase/alanine dehydrogenase-like protein (mu-crystallin family)